MSLKRPVTLAQARRWPGAAQRRESFCARMGGMRRKLTGPDAASDPDSPINRALAAWDCDKPALLKKSHVSKGIRTMKITPKMVGSEARNPRARTRQDKIDPFPSPLENYGKRAGLEGPFLMKNNRVVYYDPQEGAYYDPTTDFYLSRDEAALLHNPANKPKRRAGVVRAVNDAINAMPSKPTPKLSSTVYKYALVNDDGGFEFGMDDRTPVLFVFSDRTKKKGVYRSFRIPDAAVKNQDFQAWVRDQPSQFHYASLQGLRAVVRGFMK